MNTTDPPTTPPAPPPDKLTLLIALVRGAYDLQQLRIAMGNRICAQFRVKLGIKPSTKEETDKDAAKILKRLREEFKKITDGVTRELPLLTNFKGTPVISEYAELVLLAQYLSLESREETEFRRLAPFLDDFPIYTEFLQHIDGCGPAMGAALITKIDIHKSRYVSSLWKLAGLDTLTTPFVKEIVKGKEQLKPLLTPAAVEAAKAEGLEVLYLTRGRSRRKEHLRRIQYEDKEGHPAERDGITFDPWLKTKLFVLASCFLRSGGAYSVIYRDYKHRLENRPDWAARAPAHRHKAALRYMLKRFLADLYRAWRPLEGLEAFPEYAEAKLGIAHRPAA